MPFIQFHLLCTDQPGNHSIAEYDQATRNIIAYNPLNLKKFPLHVNRP